MAIRKVALIGANGALGSKILDALVAGKFEVTILQRASSTSTPAHGDAITIRKVPDDFPIPAVTEALLGQDAAIASFPVNDESLHVRIAEAAAAAGVSRYIPSDYGSINSDHPKAMEWLPLYARKTNILSSVQSLAARSNAFTWTSFVCGHFFDMAMVQGWLHFDLQTETADLLDGGDYKASAATLRRVGEAVVRALQREEETKNKVLYVQSVCASQKEILGALERATGRGWKRRRVDSDTFVAAERAKLSAGDGSAVEELVWVLGTKFGDWRGKEGFAMGMLGLEDEDLDEVVAHVVRQGSG